MKEGERLIKGDFQRESPHGRELERNREQDPKGRRNENPGRASQESVPKRKATLGETHQSGEDSPGKRTERDHFEEDEDAIIEDPIEGECVIKEADREADKGVTDRLWVGPDRVEKGNKCYPGRPDETDRLEGEDEENR